MDSNQIYVHLLFEYKKNKLDLDTMPSLLFIQYKYKTINSTNKNHIYINYLWNKHIENIHIKIFDNHNILIDFDVIKKYCNELPIKFQNYKTIYALCKFDKNNKV